MMAFNYPKHPLFRIAPLLDKGFQTVRFDPYERVLIAKIRSGQYSSDLWDCNSLYLGTPWRPPQFAVKSRYEMTPQELAAYRDDPVRKEERARLAEEQRARRAEKKAQREAEETKLAAHRRAMAEEKERFAEEYAAAQAKRQAENERRDREWAEWPTERAAILAGSWECTRCMKPSQINAEPDGRYAISCRICGRRTVADHATLVNVLAVHQARLQAKIVGFPL